MNYKRAREYDCKIAGLYDLLETIGKGHFATVKLAKHVFTGEKVAVKVIDKTKLDPISKTHLFQEVRCMKLVQHPNVVKLYEVIDTQTKLYLILELGDGGDMYDYIVKHDGGLKIELCQKYFRQIVDAIAYCHELHVVHRDLKPENVIFFEHSGVVKLTDFGFSNRFVPGKKLETSCGSLAYSAPEILLGDLYDAPAIDVWSLGVILYMLVCGQPPFQEANDSETLTMIMDCKYKVPAHVPPSCKDLIERMLRREPADRIKLREILTHSWVREGESRPRSVGWIDSNKGGDEVDGSDGSDGDGSDGTDSPPPSSLMGRGWHRLLTPEAEMAIVDRMVEGGISTREDILRAIENDEYNHVTATFFLLAERRLRKLETEKMVAAAVAASGVSHHHGGHQGGTTPSGTSPLLSRQNSAPGHLPSPSSSARQLAGALRQAVGASVILEESEVPVTWMTTPASPDVLIDSLSHSAPASSLRYPSSLTSSTGSAHPNTGVERRHSFIAEEEEEDEEVDCMSQHRSSFKKSWSPTVTDLHVTSRTHAAFSAGSMGEGLLSGRGKPPTPSPKSSESDIESCLGISSSMLTGTHRKSSSSSCGTGGGSVWRAPLRSVSSSPQLIPLRQIHEEREDEDIILTASGFSADGDEDDVLLLPRFTTERSHSRHGSNVSASSPFIVTHDPSGLKLRRSRSCICSDTSDSEDIERIKRGVGDRRSDKWRSRRLRERREEDPSSNQSSDTEGPPPSSSSGTVGLIPAAGGLPSGTAACPTCSRVKVQRTRRGREQVSRSISEPTNTEQLARKSSAEGRLSDVFEMTGGDNHGASETVLDVGTPAVGTAAPQGISSSGVVPILGGSGSVFSSGASNGGFSAGPKDEFSAKASLKHLATRIVDSGLGTGVGRISNISLSSNASSLLSVSSGGGRSTPHSFRRSGTDGKKGSGSGNGSGKYSNKKRSKLQTLLSSKEFSDFAESVSRDSVSLCSEDTAGGGAVGSLRNSMRVRTYFDSNKNGVICEGDVAASLSGGSVGPGMDLGAGRLSKKSNTGVCCTIL